MRCVAVMVGKRWTSDCPQRPMVSDHEHTGAEWTRTYPAGDDNHHHTGSRANVGLHNKPGIHIPWGDWRITETVMTESN